MQRISDLGRALAHRASAHRMRTALAAFAALVLSGAVVAAAGGGGTTPRHASTVTSAGFAAPLQGKVSTGDSGAAAGPAGEGAGSAGSVGSSPAVIAPMPPVPSPGPGPTPGPSLVVPGAPKIVKTASMRVQVARGRFESAFGAVASIAERYQGFVSDSNSQTVDRQAAEGTLTVRVPVEHFAEARADLARLGKVDNQVVSGQDVSGQLVDLGARIHSLQAQEQALQTLLSRTKSVGEVLDVQGQLFNVRQQIEELQAQQANLDSSASYATIAVDLFEPGAAAVTRPPAPANGLARSWHRAVHGAAAVVGGMVVVLGYTIPLAVLAGLLALAGRLWVARSRRRAVAPAA